MEDNLIFFWCDAMRCPYCSRLRDWDGVVNQSQCNKTNMVIFQINKNDGLNVIFKES